MPLFYEFTLVFYLLIKHATHILDINFSHFCFILVCKRFWKRLYWFC